LHEIHFVLKIDKQIIYFNHRIDATFHILETWFVSGLQLSIPSIKIIIIIIIIIERSYCFLGLYSKKVRVIGSPVLHHRGYSSE